ncbi:MAG: GspE/PulE family protein [Granulosicoccus sp.]
MKFDPNVEAAACMSELIARRYGLLPLSLCQLTGQLTVACEQQPELLQRDQVLRELVGVQKIVWSIATRVEIARGLDHCYGAGGLLDAVLGGFDASSAGLPGVEIGVDNAHGNTLIMRLVNTILEDAVTRRASDVHLNPEDDFVRLRYRIDGVLHLVKQIRMQLHAGIVVRIKVLAALDIAESRMPQDGQISQFIHGEQVDFRVSCFPVRGGENIVLRILDRRRVLGDLSVLGQSRDMTCKLRALLQRPDGMVVVCGPTGAGKTTTLYALLGELDSETLNVMTLEDPIEYPLEKVRQASVDPSRKIDFATGIRGLLRQDPDVLLIGEIRDNDSCAMALRATMSGHQVLTTVHASDSVAAIGRLLELGAVPNVLAASLVCVIAQRLVRLCCGCQPIGASKSKIIDEDCEVDHAGVCHECQGSGFFDRGALLELLFITPALQALIVERADDATLRRQAMSEGLETLRMAGLVQVDAGRTTLAELGRVLGNTVCS